MLPVLLFKGKLKYYICIVALNILCLAYSYAQNINLRFQHYTSDNGLSQNTVDCILKDSHGFMWFGTWNGLNRFDGYSFVVYKSENLPNSLSNNFIYAICEDKNGNLWVGTKNGLNKFDYSRNKFTRYFFEKDNPNSLPDNTILSLTCDCNGLIWIGTSNGLCTINIDNEDHDLIQISRITKVAKVELHSCQVNSILQDKKRNYWIGTSNGLVKIDSTRNKSERFLNNPVYPNSISYNLINVVFEDRYNNIWVGTQFGLNKLNPKTRVIERYYNNPDNPRSLYHFVINDIKEDCNGNLLIATLGGLNKYNTKTDDFDKFPFNQNDDYSLNNEFINSLLADDQGNVWIGTDKGGVNKYSIYQKQFGYMVHEPASSNCLSNSTINSIYDETNILWVGTAGGGLNQYDKRTGRFTCYMSNSHNSSGINNNFITTVLRDKKQNLWIGTWGGGLNKMLSPSGKGIFKKYLNSSNPNSICDVYVSSIWEDESGFLAVGNLGGLDLFYPQNEKFVHIANNVHWKNKIAEVGCILKDRKGNYWIGTRIGLFRIPAHLIDKTLCDTDIERFLNIPGDPSSIPGNYVISLYEDKTGNIWVGTYGNGICKIELSGNGKPVFKSYNEKDGLANNVVYAILEDNQHNLWLSTDNGLSRFDWQHNSFKNFYVIDGLQGNQFYWSAACEGADGRMYFGGVKGLNYFHPDAIMDYPFHPKVVLSDLKIFNTSVNIGKWNNKKAILDKAISETQRIKLSYKENVFSLEFSSLDYFLPEKIEYAYKMEGVDNDWVIVPSSRRFASYTNLKGGEYTFLVKARNSDGLWSENPTKLQITILPPFYETGWFRVLAFVIITVSVVAYFQYRTKKLKSRKKILEEMVADRTQQIEEQKEQLELQNKEISVQRDKLIELNKRVQIANQLKLRFFTNISHEFRTPLTLILGPIEKLIKSWNGDEASRQTLLLINRNAQRLLHLINQLMEFRKIETGKQDLKVSKGAMNHFIENIYQSFEPLSKQRNVDYKFLSEPITEETWFDHDKLENVMFNLLSNAFKYTPEQGKITVSLNIKPKTAVNIEKNERNSNKLIEIRVSDTGIGIDKEHLNNVFKQFYRINTPDNLKVKGSGIGLSLTKELIKAHHGTIYVESELGKGATFIIHIPYQKESFSGNEIIETTLENRKNYDAQIEVLSEELSTVSSENISDAEMNEISNKPVILIVEDNYDLRTFMAAGLQDEYVVHEAENGRLGLELAKTNSPDMVISDIMMPEMDGLELCTHLKENIHTSHIPVVLLTARSTVDNWIEGFETGADDYIAKPFHFDIFKARIKNILETRRNLRKLFSQNFNIPPAEITTSHTDEVFLKKVINVVEEHFTDPDFGVEMLIDKMAVSRSLLHKKLTALIDQTAGDFITSMRLNKSIDLLKAQKGNISEIAYQVGFNDPKYFSRIFKKHFGVTPTDYLGNKIE
jgi:ligand-binding sensor domain-containing protein/signal transduction histidine kinase/CheY-like chemotaxis protein/AraC-like DNA-binding protein